MVIPTTLTLILFLATTRMCLRLTSIPLNSRLSSHSTLSILAPHTLQYPTLALTIAGGWILPCWISISSGSLLQIPLTLPFSTKHLMPPNISTGGTSLPYLIATSCFTNFLCMPRSSTCSLSMPVFATLLILASPHIHTPPTISATEFSLPVRSWRNRSTTSCTTPTLQSLLPSKILIFQTRISFLSFLSSHMPLNSWQLGWIALLTFLTLHVYPPVILPPPLLRLISIPCVNISIASTLRCLLTSCLVKGNSP